MECPFAEVGCTFTKISSSNYQSHLSQNIEQHLQMVMKFHRTMMGSTSSNTLTEEGIVSPLQKLDAVTKEVEFLDGALDSYDMAHFPALECIKTHLKLPDLWIRSLGDKLAFRLTNFTQCRRKRTKWLTPSFFVHGGYKLRVCIHCYGTGLGYGTHISASLLLLVDNQLEWPVLLPPGTGIRVELLAEVDDDSSEDEKVLSKSVNTEIELTWKPKDGFVPHLSGSKKQITSGSFSSMIEPSNLQKRRNTWSTHNDDLKATTAKYKSSDLPLSMRRGDYLKKEGGPSEDVTLIISEKFIPLSLAGRHASEYNSLVFQVTLCLV